MNNTGNPVGSKAFPDFEDNIEILDVRLTSDQDTFKDRLGKSRLTWAGIEKAGTGDPGVIVPIVQQAVQDVVDGVDGQTARAVAAADRAESASGSAAINADIRPSISDAINGPNPVPNGAQFQVLSEDSLGYIRYRREGMNAAEVGRFPSQRGVTGIVQAEKVSVQLPNLLSTSQVISLAPPRTVASEASTVVVGGTSATEVVASGSAARCYWSVPASDFRSGQISASVTIVQADAGSSGAVRVYQRNGSTIVSEHTIAVGSWLGAAISENMVFSGGPIPLNQNATSVDLDVLMAGEGRKFITQFPMLADGANAGFRHSKDRALPALRMFTEEATNAARFDYPLPLNIPVAFGVSGEESTVVVTPYLEDYDRAVALRMVSSYTASDVCAFKIGDMLSSTDIIRLTVTAETVPSNNPAFGLLFGTGANLRGFGLRSNAQLLTLNLAQQTGSVSGPPARPYIAGDTITMDARLLEGTPGSYTVRYFVEYSDGERCGPYDVSGISSLDEIWFGSRLPNTWTNITAARFGPAMYLDEFVQKDAGGGGASGVKIFHVAPSGSDGNDGSFGAPFKTIAKALGAMTDGGIIEVANGEYRETLAAGAKANIWIRSKVGERAVVLGSEQLAVTKSDGYTQVYQAPLANKPVGMGGSRGKPVIFEWGTPSKPIPPTERSPMQRGKSHRLPYTEMFEAGSLTDLDTPEGRGSWWWDAGVIYFAATDGSDARQKRYEARTRITFQQSGGAIRLSRMDIMFSSSYGASFRGQSVMTDDVSVLGSYHNGFYHQAGTWFSHRDESGGNGNDGFNGTVASRGAEDESGTRITGIFYDPWGHDNGDDGTSYHYRGDQTIYGGLFEHNTKADVVHVTGAAVTCYGTVVRGSTHGFYAADAPVLDDSRVVTSLRCINTKAIDNQYSYRVTSGSVLECDNALSIDPVVSGYTQSGDGVLLATDCRYIGEPGKEKQGDVTIIKTEALI